MQIQRNYKLQKQSQKFNSKFLNIGSSLLQAFLKSKMSINKKNMLQNIKNHSQFHSKRTELFTKSISKIISKKQLKNRKQVISILLQNRITNVLAKREKLSQLKQDSYTKSLTLFLAIVTRNINKKTRDTFLTIKAKSLLNFQSKNYKMVYLMNSIKKIQRNSLTDALNNIKFESFRRLARYKRCFILERLYLKKRREHMIDGFNSVFDFCSTKIQNEQLENKKELQKHQKLTTTMIKQLEQQRSKLQSQLTSVKSQSTNLLESLSGQLSAIEQQLQSIRFEYDLNVQDNDELKQSLKERQNQKNLSEERKVNGISAQKDEKLGKNKLFMSEQKLWESVLSNLLMYLIKCKNRGQSNSWSLEKFTQILTQPLADIHLYPTTAELDEENAVLKELLETYKQSFPEIQIQSDKKLKLPSEISIKEKNFLIRSLECLSRWGTEAGEGLEGVRSILQKLKNK